MVDTMRSGFFFANKPFQRLHPDQAQISGSQESAPRNPDHGQRCRSSAKEDTRTGAVYSANTIISFVTVNAIEHGISTVMKTPSLISPIQGCIVQQTSKI